MRNDLLNSEDTKRLAYQAAVTGSYRDMIALMDLAGPLLGEAEIDSSDGWRNLAMLSQFCFTLGNQVTLRSAAEAACRNRGNVASDDDVRMAIITQAAGGLADLRDALPLIDDPTHNAHYMSSRLGALAFGARDLLVIEACVQRLAKQEQVLASLADPQMELEIMLACQSISEGRGYHRQRLMHALRIVNPQWRQRYAQHLGALFGTS